MIIWWSAAAVCVFYESLSAGSFSKV
jgi:hypothetical protein